MYTHQLQIIVFIFVLILENLGHCAYLQRSKNYTSFALPPQSSNNEVFDESSDFDSCKMYPKKITTTQTSNDLCIPESFDNFSTISCDSYVYDTSLFPETFTISLDLVIIII